MHEVFLSYSRRDSSQALELADRLRQNQVQVWLDQHSIQPAASWSSEIVQALDRAKVLIVLLSTASVESDNVVRELSLAFEARKTILPVDLEPVTLPTQFRYPLAGIQRANVQDFDSILRALNTIGIGAPASDTRPKAPTTFHGHGQMHQGTDANRSLIILPFDDLSPSGDNRWFADGLSSELIDALNHIKSLRVLDRKTSLDLRGVPQSTAELGRLFNTRYFVEGSVRKYGDEIKISISLLDVQTGERVWQESHRGEFKDIFDIQESVARKVVEAFKLHLTSEEQSRLVERKTDSPEAYELLAKSNEYFLKQTKEGLQHSIDLSTEAIRIDPMYAPAYQSKAISLSIYYRSYSGDISLLQEAEALCRKALELRPNYWIYFYTLSTIYVQQKKIPEAEAAARTLIDHAPDSYLGHFALGIVYWVSEQFEQSIAPYEEAVRLMPENLPNAWNLLIALDATGNTEKQAYWAKRCLPFYERYLRLHPDDELSRVCSAALLLWSGNREAALERTLSLTDLQDANSLVNVAGLLEQLGEFPEALKTFQKALEAGCRRIEGIKTFMNSDKLNALRATGDYQKVMRLMQVVEPDWNPDPVIASERQAALQS